jgi:hypothetical protein
MFFGAGIQMQSAIFRGFPAWDGQNGLSASIQGIAIYY